MAGDMYRKVFFGLLSPASVQSQHRAAHLPREVRPFSLRMSISRQRQAVGQSATEHATGDSEAVYEQHARATDNKSGGEFFATFFIYAVASIRQPKQLSRS